MGSLETSRHGPCRALVGWIIYPNHGSGCFSLSFISRCARTDREIVTSYFALCQFTPPCNSNLPFLKKKLTNFSIFNNQICIFTLFRTWADHWPVLLAHLNSTLYKRHPPRTKPYTSVVYVGIVEQRAENYLIVHEMGNWNATILYVAHGMIAISNEFMHAIQLP
jgi:hypothetical protein